MIDLQFVAAFLFGFVVGAVGMYFIIQEKLNDRPPY